MNWLSKLFNPQKSVQLADRFDSQKSSLILLPPGNKMGILMDDLMHFLKDHNVFLINDFTDLDNSIRQILSKTEGQKLFVAGYGKSGVEAYYLVKRLELMEIEACLILLDACLDKNHSYSTDKKIIDELDHFKAYFTKDLNPVNQKISKEKIRKLVHSQSSWTLRTVQKQEPISSDIYVFRAIGGVNMIDDEGALHAYTRGQVYYFPVNGHHYELLRDYLFQDLGFFVSNVMKGRHNLLSFTLTTQSATPNWYKDLDGRPMGEGKAPDSCKKEVAFEMKKCPYPGSRKDHENPMNVSALKQMRSAWQDSLNLIRFLRDMYLKNHPRKSLELIDVWKITMYASYLPTFMLYRNNQRFLNHCVPPMVAAVYKMFIGLKAPVEKMIQDEFTGKRTFENLTSKVIHDYAEENNSFVGPEEVCGGPENLVVEFLEAFMNLEEEVEEDPLFEKIIPDEQKFTDFVHQLANVQILQNIYFQQTQFLVKQFLKLSEEEQLNNRLREDFFITEEALKEEEHAGIVEKLSDRLEEKELFKIKRFGKLIFDSTMQVKAADHEMNNDFFDNITVLEKRLLNACEYDNKVVVNESIFHQYMGFSPFSTYYETEKEYA